MNVWDHVSISGENGSYSCLAQNRAGPATTNFTLSVAKDAEVSGFLEIGLDHLVIFSICVIIVLLLLVIIVTLLLIHLFKKHTEKKSEEASSHNNQSATNMPKYIQMGKGGKIPPPPHQPGVGGGGAITAVSGGVNGVLAGVNVPPFSVHAAGGATGGVYQHHQIPPDLLPDAARFQHHSNHQVSYYADCPLFLQKHIFGVI